MKTIRNLCAATTLLIVLSISALAGEISTNVVSPPPPPPASATATEPEPGEITTMGTQNDIESETLLTEITLSLLQLFAVF
jgi:hypothetical protein